MFKSSVLRLSFAADKRVLMLLLFKIVHMVAAVFLVLVVLLQSGRGGGMGTALSGATGQIFGGRGANTFLTRLTSGTAMVFFCTSLTLSMLSSHHHSVVRGQTRKPAAAQSEAGASGEAAPADGASETEESASPDDDHLEAGVAPSDKVVQDPSKPDATPLGVPSGDNSP